MTMVTRARVQYVFLDIVNFTKQRSVEAQSDIIDALNAIVREAIKDAEVPRGRQILLPTGDGMAICLLDVRDLDAHMRVALSVLRRISAYRSSTPDAARRFRVRIGVNENVDNVVLDINRRRNVAGAGISIAQRIMSNADADQILISQSVYDVLRQREVYMSAFRSFTAKDKHGASIPVYQLLVEGEPGLNAGIPSAFAPKEARRPRLDKFTAYYIAHASTNAEFLLSQKNDSLRKYASTVLLSFRAEDSVEAASAPEHESPSIVTWQASSATFEEQYRYYRELDFWVLCRLSELLEQTRLQRYEDCFEDGEIGAAYAFVTPAAIQRLVEEQPQVASEFGLGPGS